MAAAPADLIPARGAVGEPILLEVERQLTAQDLPRLVEAPNVSVPILQKLRAVHHRQAQLIAEGRSLKEVAAILGCTPQRLTQLQVDPTFRDLVAYYQDQQMALRLTDAARLADKITDLGEQAVDELIDRFEDDGKRKAMHVGEVRKIAEFAMDRTVAPPKVAAPASTPPAAITINFGTAVKRQPDGKTIEGQVAITMDTATLASPLTPHVPAPQPEEDFRLLDEE